MRKWIASVSLVLAGCGAAPFAAAPTLVSTSPADKATGVAIDTSISATFSESMLSGSFEGSTFSLSPSATGSLTVAGATVTFKPAAPLAYGTTYTATISTAAKGTAGGPLAANAVWSFTTRPLAPVVISTSPANAAGGVAIEGAITATFSQEMSGASITATSFTLNPPAVGVTFSSSGSTATLNHTEPLAYGTAYTATITTEAKNTSGTPLGANYSWTFTTGVDAAPTVTATSPASGATSVAVASTITATFSKAMIASSITAQSFTISPTVAGTVAYAGGTATFTLASGARLQFNTLYTATVTTAAKDAAGTSLATNYSWTFTTVPEPPGPDASAGNPQDVNRGSVVTLHGGGKGATGYPIAAYAWTQVGGPFQSTLQQPTLNAPPDVGTLLFDLVVTDTLGRNSAPSRTQVNVMEDATKAIFVAISGNDANPGTSRTAPRRTIQGAINVAVANGADVYIGVGAYSESLTLATGVSLYGGFDAAWIRNAVTSGTQVIGGTRAVLGSGVSGLTIDGLTVISAAAGAAGSSSYGFLFANSNDVTLTHNRITAGAGGAGTSGSAGTVGGGGLSGGAGSIGCTNCALSAGGAGGGPTTSNAGGGGGKGNLTADGSAGSSGGGTSAGSGGAGGTFRNNTIGSAGTRGGDATANGATGSAGPDGADEGGTAGATGYLPVFAGSGGTGSPGSGGGGGGASGGYCNAFGCSDQHSGNGGGGGGQGGTGGTGGSGGQGGGGSFGIYSYQSTITQTGNVIQVPLSRAAGGAGGAGGTGGSGGGGGTGASSSLTNTILEKGGDGGSGSAGGRGGAGGKGGAGPATPIYIK